MQMEEWARLARNSPRGDDIPRDIMKGFGKNRYLSLNEIELSMHVKPRPPRKFFTRLKLGFKVMFGQSLLRHQEPFEYDLCSSNDKDAEAMKLTIKRLDNGKLKASYKPADQETTTIIDE